MKSYAETLESYLITEEGFLFNSMMKRLLKYKGKLDDKREKKEWTEKQKKWEDDKRAREAELNRMSPEERREYELKKKRAEEERDKLSSKVYTFLKSECNKINRDQKWKEKLYRSADNFYKNVMNEDPEFYTRELNEVKVAIKNGPCMVEEDSEGYFIVINGDQEMSCICGDVLEYLANRVMDKFPEVGNVDTGEGDEGCIYPEKLML